MKSHDLLGSIEDEFAGAEIPDWRLRTRLLQIVSDLEEKPEATLPKALKTEAAREGAYRFLGNARVTLDGILAPHVRATAKRCAEAGAIYVVSDTTECAFNGDGRGSKLGRLQGKSRGFLAHVALAVTADGTRKPLGVLGIDTWMREDELKDHKNVYQQKKDPERESLKWSRMMVQASSALGPDVNAIHLMDSEADIYELLHEAQHDHHRFIIRSGQERRVADGLLSQTIARTETLLTREVLLSRRQKATNRRNPPRAGRSAKLEISSAVVQLKRPKTSNSSLPGHLSVNLVCVRETEAPDGEQPIEWILFTSEPISTDEEIAAVIDGYRTRWVIEEYFKALKTGCSYETRELESMRTLTNFLAIAAVLAWRLLLIRSLERQNSNLPATEAAAPVLLEALAAFLRKKRLKLLPPNPTVADLMKGIAALGGHITNNGPPGWLVLWRGYQDLLIWADGFILGKSIAYSDQS